MNNYIKFNNRNWSYAGDKGSWVSQDEKNNTITINKARRGIISDAYISELNEYLDQYGVDFSSMSCGERKTIKI